MPPGPALAVRRSHFVAPALAYAERLGIDVGPIVRELGLEGHADGTVPITLEGHRALLAWLSKAMNDPSPGVTIGKEVGRGAYGLVEYIGRCSRDIGESLEAFARYAVLLDDLVVVSVEREGERLFFRHAIPGEAQCLGPHGNEAYLTVFATFGRELTGGDVPMARAWFAHQDGGETDRHAALAKALAATRIDFGAKENGFVLERAAFERPILHADPVLRELLVAQAEQRLATHDATAGRFMGRVKEAIHDQLRERLPTVESVARATHLGERTLQRELAKRSTTFQDVVDDARDELARRYLRDTAMSIARIASAVHYSAPSAFVRAFHRRTGKTPGDFRRG